ncbi:MAG: hypothetical protein LLF96_01855 [Eubacteriales bacterium]|nr:hypothetical protein [Eubacteriales bacterium]
MYCLEETDNVHCLWNLSLDTRTKIEEENQEALLEGIVKLAAKGFNAGSEPGNALYAKNRPALRLSTLSWVPYYAWCNREPGNIQVWTREIT